MVTATKKRKLESGDVAVSTPENASAPKDAAERKRRQSSAFQPLTTNPKNENGIAECFHKVNVWLYVSLAPAFLSNPTEGIRVQHLDPLLMTYYPQAGGVVLAHYNLKIRGQTRDDPAVMAKVMYDSPIAYLWINVDLLVWKPMAGDVVEGWINLQSPSHVGLLIHDTFNASIKRDSIPSEWQFIPNEADEGAADSAPATDEDVPSKGSQPRSLGYWVDGSGQRVDGKLRFTVKAFYVTGRVVSVQGTLLPLGQVREDLTQRTPAKKPAAVSKKHVHFDGDSTGADETNAGDEDKSESSGEDASEGSSSKDEEFASSSDSE